MAISATVMAVVSYATAAYSAVSAIKALKDGNIMGAVMAGVGAYVGFTAGGAYAAAAGGDSLATSAVASGMTEGVGSSFAQMGGALNTGAAVPGAMSSLGSEAMSVGALSTLADAGASFNPFDGSTNIGAKVETPNVSVEGGGFMNSLQQDPLGTIKDKITSMGGSVKGALTKLADGTFQDASGSIFDKAGKMLSGSNGMGLAKIGAGAMDYMAKKDQIESTEKIADESYERAVKEAARERGSRGAAPGYVYDFGQGRVA